ncbi:MAG: type II toxin-antitoxin system Phd/YefM family antitoxin [Solirubrobacterales bacterium]
MSEISATQFKARCLALLDEVAQGGGELVVTKHGRPVARVVPADEEVSLRGSVAYHVGDEELIAPIDVEWTAADAGQT